MKAVKLLLLALLLAFPAVMQAQFTFTTNNDGSLNIAQYTGSGGPVVIPDTTNGMAITTIGIQAFSSLITSVTMGTNMVNIGEYAFVDCPLLTNVVIGDSVTNIGEAAFAECPLLINVVIPNSVTSIAQGEFLECNSLTTFTIGDSVTNIASYAFQESGLASVTIGTNVISIGDQAFSFCPSLTSITIPDSITNMGQYPLEGSCALTNAVIGNGMTSVVAALFAGCTDLVSVTLGTNITTIAAVAFTKCSSLSSLTLPPSLTTIGNQAFYGCTSLTNLIIPPGVNSLDGAFAFADLTATYFEGDAPTNAESPFWQDNDVTVYYLPGTTGWSEFAANQGVPIALWLPQMQNGGFNFGGQTNQFGFNINWAGGQTVVVEACTNLSDPVWEPLQTNVFAGTSMTFNDPQWTNYPNRFYRIASP